MRIALVLGSGGARGYAHIGVIEELKTRGHDIAVISGSSMGALIGGLEAAGGLDDFTQWARSLGYFDVLRNMDISLGKGGVLKAHRFIGVLEEFCQHAHIENLPIPYTAVATDITARREIWFQRGPLASAIRASIAVPGFITPVLLGDHLLVDGGVLNPVPVEPTLAVPTDLTISVSLHGRDELLGVQLLADAGNIETTVDEEENSPLARRIGEKIASFFSRGTEEEKEKTDREENGNSLESLPDSLPLEETGIILGDASASIVDVMEMSLSTMEEKIEEIRRAVCPAHLHIAVPGDICSSWDFHRADEVIESGRALAASAFDCAGI